MTEYTEEQWINWIDLLAEKDYLVIDNFISAELLHRLQYFFTHHVKNEKFEKAGIGTVNHTVNNKIRGDEVFWLDKGRDFEQIEGFYEIVDTLKNNLNRYCYLGIADYEFHMAHYPKGTFYKRHLDQFKERNNRMITLIFYLNEDWKEGDGGELNIYTTNETITVAPIARRMVIFKSDVLEHEVLVTNTGRDSITGWYLNQPVGLGFLP